ncbi:MAG: ABC transporter ATP-binding protein [Bdellovibrionales bacterium CG12_big_fil_rev_8_21_14_0_65_38_15]|nr:MAG: ABC transporter ATP-binding protein [Bdellovibrionales bacterium CG22_combo_CG10-13_8_21_14_all_38_13]PIQ56362.1 MAG: ABC transporter ATP-binding protein [Bdellovibrionales bacterium CG12_big_fil_rev_8_21_14_0_65_38_15]PIR29393.1 MAG: ABC transporter ATP-binding protein [Bdellovibrionales bacterium CG11_big_fil_rev_8_21_14_0_20_38_13]
MSTILEIKDLNVHYGSIHAIHGINLKVEEGEIVTLIGSNGAGKTTTLHTISGLLKPTSGSIVFKGEEIQAIPAHKIVAKGLAQSPEGRMVFPDLTVGENLEMGAFLRNDKDGIKADLKKMFTLFPRLEERRKQLAGTLSGGEQQMLAIARAYMAKPKLLLLDEPSLGIAPILVQAIFDAIVEINKSGMTVLLVEQNAYAALKIAHRGYVLTTGEIAMQGPSAELISNEEIRKAYLGH